MSDNSQSIHMPSDRFQELIKVIIQNQLAGLVGRVAEMQAKIDILCTENKQLLNEIVNLNKTVQKVLPKILVSNQVMLEPLMPRP
jgi:hypothetical protein